MKVIFFTLILTSLFAYSAIAQKNIYEEDFQFFWRTINENYAYFDKKQTDWNKVKEIYETQASQIKEKQQFIRLLEIVFRELYDNHAQLNTNLDDSSRLVPSGTDIWAEWQSGKAIITDLRKGFGAEKSGLQVGMEIVSFNGKPINEAVHPFIGKSLKQIDVEVKNWALLTLLAGDHKTKRVIEAKTKEGNLQTFMPDEATSLLENISSEKLLDFRQLENNIGYLKINNSLGDEELIKLFDEALDNLKNTNGLILDLRDTPSGGYSSVARGIMSRFVKEEKIFQKHSLPAEERESGVKRSWFEIVSPRGTIYEKPVVVLVNHWTGSMGEGIAIGFDGMKRAVIIGTKMAGLNGAMETFQMPNTKINFSFAAEKIFHINGQPRENFVPVVLVDRFDNKRDIILETGIKQLGKMMKKK